MSTPSMTLHGARRGRASLRCAILATLLGLPLGPLLTGSPATAQTLAGEQLAPPRDSAGTTVVPDRFLRRWDPVTVFFRRDTGPSAGGPEDDPARLVQLRPAHSGAWTWIDRRTLQFRPADPWPPLGRFTILIQGRDQTLDVLLEAPSATLPADGATGLDPVPAITLTFVDPVDPAAIEQLVRIELTPLPGLDAGEPRWLDGTDFDVKAVAADGRHSYVLALRQPIATGTQAVVHLGLGRGEALVSRVASFSTAPPFRAIAVGCTSTRYPIAAGGSTYGSDQLLRCPADNPAVVVELSAPPAPLTPIIGRNLVRIAPPVANLAYTASGHAIEVRGDFRSDVDYEIRVAPTPLQDRLGRPLENHAASTVHVLFPPKPEFLRWRRGEGIAERRGPQRVPLEGRGHAEVDLRIHRIDPLDRSLWPFPPRPLTVDEAERPPGPGEEPTPHGASHNVASGTILKHLRLLGSPPISTVATLPLARGASAASFGLDLAGHLGRIEGGPGGSYLIGIRNLDGSTERSWMRLQVTDLSLTTIEEPHHVQFVVTSLASARPVVGAQVRIEGSRGKQWVTFGEGRTGADGSFRWPAPGKTGRDWQTVRRIVVEHAGDVLVLDPERPPQRFRDEHWQDDASRWLQWTVEPLTDRGEQPDHRLHLFSDRPVYRPEDVVHFKGWVRQRLQGKLTALSYAANLVIAGPGEREWRYPVEVDAQGAFDLDFLEADLPTGSYSAWLEEPGGRVLDGCTFRKEAYRIPRFEVTLTGPDRAPSDGPFAVGLTATYYAGGRVGGQPIDWRVTRFPYDWRPAATTGFLFSSDGRYSDLEPFEASPRLDQRATTDADGGARLELDPSAEANAQPSSYVIEATVTGDDDQTVTATKRIVALPPFVLGLKLPRFLDQVEAIEPEIVVLGSDEQPVVGHPVTVRLLQRQWHSHLSASDFSDGTARWVTDVVDEPLLEQKVTSTKEPLRVRLAIAKAGVYIVEVEAHDRLNRRQLVRADLYAGGIDPIAWKKPTSRELSAKPDAAEYAPGSTANVVLQSPFQRARALAVIEAPEGNRYQWLNVRGGSATLRLPILDTWAPRLPVHLVLARGRAEGTGPAVASGLDLGKPETLATTVWLAVAPVRNQLTVELEAPSRAEPGSQVPITVRLRDPRGAPVAGTATLWMVDQAVLALGREQRLDPLPDFVIPAQSWLSVIDTRGLSFGELPFAPLPGGGDGEPSNLFDRATVRKNFQPVPVWLPRLEIDRSGSRTVQIQLPDNLTNFKLRAKAVSGPERFGFAVGHLEVRLPLIVEAALPRFVRPGDRFLAGAIGRVVEGDGGAGSAALEVSGALAEGPTTRELDWDPSRPERLEFPVTIPQPSFTADGRLERDAVTFRVAVVRASDGARDAFEVALPIRDDRRALTERLTADLEPGVAFAIPALTTAARPGSVRRTVLVAGEPALLRMAAGLDMLLQYPHGCTEQRLSRGRARLAFARLLGTLEREIDDPGLTVDIRQTIDWISGAIDGDGLVGYWPGAEGYVSLTAWALQFLVEVRHAGLELDDTLTDRLVATLRRALRSDYRRFVGGAAYAERAWALTALASAGELDAAYLAELARKSQFLDLESRALITSAFEQTEGAAATTAARLASELWDGLIFRSHQGREIFGGLQTGAAASPLILPSTTRTLAQVTRALARIEPGADRLPVLIDGLVTLGRDDGWGSTNANAAALLALVDHLGRRAPGRAQQVDVDLGGDRRSLTIGGDGPRLVSALSPHAGDDRVTLARAAGSGGVAVLAETTFTPLASGRTTKPIAAGFVVTRAALRVTGADAPLERSPVEADGELDCRVGDVIEEHVQVVNTQERHFVAVDVPLAAGVEPLNPHLLTSPPEATPRHPLTLAPSYAQYLDDRVTYYYDVLPPGTFDFYHRVRAIHPGTFVQPAASAELMYDASVHGSSAGAAVAITPAVARE